MTRLYARTPDEAHVYMDQHPCVCGDIDFDRKSAVMEDTDGVLCSRYYGTCRTDRRPIGSGLRQHSSVTTVGWEGRSIFEFIAGVPH